MTRDETSEQGVAEEWSPGSQDRSTTVSDYREGLLQRLVDGASGSDVVSGFTEFVDGLLIGRYRDAAGELSTRLAAVPLQQCCVVALGGYGRRELAPFSDIDIMFLYRKEGGTVVQVLSRAVLHYLWDLGFQVGHSVRTIQDCVRLAAVDLTIRTSVMEARYLSGGRHLFHDFERRYWRRVGSRRVGHFIDQKVLERQKEYEKFGETVYVLEPNVKKSQGGLRDLHLLQWIGLVTHQASDIHVLADKGYLSRQDFSLLCHGREFLWRVRALLHCRAGMAQEILSFDEQVWLAQLSGYQDRPNLLAVEQFMQQYYLSTRGIYETLLRFVNRCRPISALTCLRRWWPSTRIEGDFVVSGASLTVVPDKLDKVLGSPHLVLRMFEIAQQRDLKLDTGLLEDVQSRISGLKGEAFHTTEASRIFRRILAGPNGVARTLEGMHRAQLLEKMIPVFSRVRGLMQFNQYHKFTVDEHSLFAVGKAEAMANEPGLLGAVYQEIPRKDLLHLAILLHDVGKGMEGDHSEIGKSIAEDTAARLGYGEQETRTLAFLVHKHLMMAHTAFRRDPSDEKVLLAFVRAVGTPEVLKKLYVLTAADIAAVGPGVLTKWKESLLAELYVRALQEVSGQREAGGGSEGLKDILDQVMRELPVADDTGITEPWVSSQLAQFPLRYAYGTPPSRIAAHVAAIATLHEGEVQVDIRFNERLDACEYAVISSNTLTPGLFSKIAGVMASLGLQVLDAQILTRSDGIVVDTFHVCDPDYPGFPPPERKAKVSRTIRAVLKGEENVDHLLARSQRLSSGRLHPAHRQPTEVRMDNETSDHYTIIDVFADDRQGLLYVITHAIAQLGLSVHAARISTRLDQAADVFYVTDRDGGKIHPTIRLDAVRARILEHIDRSV